MPREVFVCKHFPRSSTSNCFASSMTCNREHARRSPRTFCFLLESTCDASWHQRTLLESMFSLSLSMFVFVSLSLFAPLCTDPCKHPRPDGYFDYYVSAMLSHQGSTTYYGHYIAIARDQRQVYPHTPHATLFVSLVCSFVGLVSC
jgi:hypothetical protein